MIRIETQISFFSVPLVVICCMQSLSEAQQCEWDFVPQDYHPGVLAATTGICTADFNGDGWLDIAISNRGTDNVCVFVGDGAGDFELLSCVDIGSTNTPRYVVAGDLDGDGDIDAATSNWNGAFDDDYPGGSVSILLNDGFGFLTVFDEHLFYRASCIDIADLNEDGHLDLVVPHWDLTQGSQGPGITSILLNNGDASFKEVQVANGIQPRGVDIGDLDGDGDLDIAISNLASNTVTIVENLGSNNFNNTVHTLKVGTGPRFLAIGDLDDDGLSDLAVVHKDVDTLGIYLNQGGMIFSWETSYKTADNPHSTYVEDINGDCNLDVIVSHVGENVIYLYKNNGLGELELPQQLVSLHAPAHVITADVNGDDKPDILTADVNGGYFSVHVSEVIQKICSFCYGDLTGDGSIDVTDLLALLSDWNQPKSPTFCISDLSDDGIVNVTDLLIVVGNWGPCTD